MVPREVRLQVDMCILEEALYVIGDQLYMESSMN
jgi:hypothetical protein